MWGIGRQLRLEHGADPGFAQAGQQDLAVRGRVQRDALADPVVALDRGVARYLVEVEGCAIGEDCDVDRLAGALGQKFGNRAGLLDDVETGSGGSGKAEDAQPQTVLSAMLVLFDEAASLKRRDDAGGR